MGTLESKGGAAMKLQQLNWTIGCLVGLALVLGIVPRTRAELINGSFELGPSLSDSFVRLPIGNTSITGWQVFFGGIDYVGPIWVHSDGNRSLDLDGNVGEEGGILQAFATGPGVTYDVSFDLAGNVGSGPTVKEVFVRVRGNSLVFAQSFFFNTTGKSFSDMGWTTHQFSFVADSTSATLSFRSLTGRRRAGSGWGPALDNVVVIPEPSTFTLASIGILIALGSSRRRQTSTNEQT